MQRGPVGNRQDKPGSRPGRLAAALRSVRLAAAVLVVLAIVSALGTVIPRGRPPDFYSATYGRVAGALINWTGFADVYHAWWFITLLAWLLVSMSVCSLSRLGALLRESPVGPRDPDTLAPGCLRGTIACAGEPPWPETVATTAARIRDWLLDRHYRVTASPSEPCGCLLAAEKGRAGRFGSLIVHGGAVVVLLGGSLSGIFGVTQRVKVGEGETVEVPDTPLAVQLQEFSAAYHPDTDHVSEYRSRVSVLKGGTERATGAITVNHPLRVDGFRFYQMNYRVDVRDVVVRATRGEDGAVVGAYRLRLGQPQRIADLDLGLEALAFQPDFVFHNGVGGSRSERFRNPAVLLAVSEGDEPAVNRWVFPVSMGMPHGGDGTYAFDLADYERRHVSGLKVVRDLGRPVVYAGYVMLIVGAFLSCYLFHRQLLVRVTSAEDGIRIAYGVPGARNPIDLEQELGRLAAFLGTPGPGQPGPGSSAPAAGIPTDGEI